MAHNIWVPFTLAHGAAALPFRHTRIVFSGLLIGSFAPDFEYFLRLAPDDGFGHTLLGVFVLTLPLALLVLWLFHDFVKLPLARLLPDAIQCRLTGHLEEFRFRGTGRFTLIVGSILLGIATHLVWDSFHAFEHMALPSLADSQSTVPCPDCGDDSVLQGPSAWQHNHWNWSSLDLVGVPLSSR